MEDKLAELTKNLARNRPASPSAIAEVARLVPGVPSDYLAFLEESNGAEGAVGGGYLALWPAEEIAPLNEEYAVREFAPGLVLFASDGADTGFAFDTRTVPPTVVEVPLVGMSLDLVRAKARGLLDLLERIAGGN